MSGAAHPEPGAVLRAAWMGVACGLALGAGAAAVGSHLVDRIRRR